MELGKNQPDNMVTTPTIITVIVQNLRLVIVIPEGNNLVVTNSN